MVLLLQSVKTGHAGHSTSLTLSDFSRVPFLEHLVLMYFSGKKKNWRKDVTLCRAWSTASPRAKVYEHRVIRHHCWRACWQLSSPLTPSINLHSYLVRNQKGGSADVIISQFTHFIQMFFFFFFSWGDVIGMFQGEILEWSCHFSSRAHLPDPGWSQDLLHCRQTLLPEPPGKP